MEDAAVDKEALSGSQAERLPASAEQDFTLRHQGNLDLWVPVADIPVAGTGHLLTCLLYTSSLCGWTEERLCCGAISPMTT